jgi:DNA-binding NarL/FixJ family response regulator
MAVKQRILLVDDHEVVRLGLKSLLDRHSDFEVVAEAGTAREAIDRVATHNPDVVVMDIRLPGGSGIEACEEISEKYPNTKVIMLTSYAEDEMLFSAIRAGASGYVLKQIGGEDLVRAIEAVGRGEALLDPAVTQRIFQEVRKAAKEEEAPHSPLSHSRKGMFCCWSLKARPTVRSPRPFSLVKGQSAIMSAASFQSLG